MGCSQAKQVLEPTRDKPEASASRSSIDGAGAGGFHEIYALGKKLGSGAFAQVRVAIPRGSSLDEAHSNRAVKILDMRVKSEDLKVPMPPDAPRDPEKEKEARHEVDIWRKVCRSKNPHTVALLDEYWDDACCYMVMERIDSQLLSHLEKANVTEGCLARIFHQMLRALAHLHNISVVHRDVKPDNFLVNGASTIKLTDFGLSVVLPGDRALKGIAGTAPFMSPEMLKHSGYAGKTDVWSLGVLIYVLVYGQFPYFSQEKSSKAMKMAIKEGSLAPSFRPAKGLAADVPRPSPQLDNMMHRMLQRDTFERPDGDALLADPYWSELQEGNRVPEDGNFKPMLHSAVRAGAFVVVKKKDKDGVKDRTDEWLSQQSQQRSSTSGSVVSWCQGSAAKQKHGREEGLSQSSTNASLTPTLSSVPTVRINWPGTETAF